MNGNGRLHGDNIEAGTIAADKLTENAKADIRQGTLLAGRVSITNFSFPAASSATVTTAVLAAALTDTPQSTISAAKGIYTGVISGISDPKKVLVRYAGTDNGIDDGTGDDVYGVLSEASGIYTLSLKKANGTTFTFGSITAVDFLFVEIFDLDNLPPETFLLEGIGGVIDATAVDAIIAAQATADQAEANAQTAISDAADAQADADAAQTDLNSYTNLLKLREHPSNKKRIIVNPAETSHPDGSSLIQEINQLRLKFDGAQLDFSNGNIYDFTGTNVVGTFTVPAITNGNFKWVSVTVIPSTIDALNRVTGVLQVIAGTVENPVKAAAGKATFSVGKSLGQIALFKSGGVVADIFQTDIERLFAGSGGGSSVIVKETPAGTIDGVNDEFILNDAPLSASSTFIFVDGLYVPVSGFSLSVDTITFQAAYIPKIGQDIEVFYIPDPLGGFSPGSSVDLGNITVSPTPATDNSVFLGSTTKGWKGVFLRDQSTGSRYRLEIDNGIIQAVLVV